MDTFHPWACKFGNMQIIRDICRGAHREFILMRLMDVAASGAEGFL